MLNFVFVRFFQFSNFFTDKQRQVVSRNFSLKNKGHFFVHIERIFLIAKTILFFNINNMSNETKFIINERLRTVLHCLNVFLSQKISSKFGFSVQNYNFIFLKNYHSVISTHRWILKNYVILIASSHWNYLIIWF